MPRFDDDAICLRQWDWSETSQTVLLFTRAHGLVKAIAKGSKRPKSNFDGGLEPLTRGVASATGKPGAGLATLTAWSLEEPFAGLRGSYDTFLASSVACDVCRRLFELLDPHPEAFDALATCLERLDAIGREIPEIPPSAVVLPLGRLVAKLLHDAGHFPELHNDVRTERAIQPASVHHFSPNLGGLVLPGADRKAGERAGDRFGDREGEIWQIRSQTVDRLRGFVDEEGPDTSPNLLATDLRALRFLVTWTRYRTGDELTSASMLLARPSIAPLRPDDPTV